MNAILKIAAVILLVGASVPVAQAQARASKWPIQVHGFASQGFAVSGNNNYLTMRTSEGSFAMTDGGINATARITRNLRVGAQLYVRNIGTLGEWRPIIDWAVADYKAKDWLVFRGGKVKTVFGLYNDSQDMEALHTWAILPQSIYSLDLRSSTIAHMGGDVAGEIALPENMGSLSYTVFSGRRSDDKWGGYRNVTLQNGVRMDTVRGWMAGGDLRWTKVNPGITVGFSRLEMPFQGIGKLTAFPLPVTFDVHAKAYIFYADYMRGNLHLNAEYSRGSGLAKITGVPGTPEVSEPLLGWYVSAAYRVSSHLELGTYHSRYISNVDKGWDDPANHIYDQVITARFDINRYWSVKAEGHFIDGYGSVYSARGFYLGQNPNGFTRKTNMFVLRTGYTF